VTAERLAGVIQGQPLELAELYCRASGTMSTSDAVVEKWKSRVISCTTDGGSNVYKAAQELFPVAFRPCIAHRTQLLLKYLVLCDRNIASQISACQAIAARIRHVCVWLSFISSVRRRS